MMELYFIRHGQASFGEADYDRLSPVGELQALLLGRRFRKSGARFDAVYSGSLKRQVQTAKIVMNQMDGGGGDRIIIDSNFNELESSDRMINRLYAVIRGDRELAARMKQIHNDYGAIGQVFDVAAKTGALAADEDTRIRRSQQFRERISNGIGNLISQSGENRKVAVFTSGGPTAVALRKTLETSKEQMIRLGWELRNTSITVLRYDQGRLQLVLFNCVAHLEAQNDPELITYI